MNCMFSIIVPVYNVKDYLEICVRSIINQGFPDYELIIIDDCSTDGSTDLIYTLMSLSSQIRIIKHDRNLGLGGARNTGAKYATGQYLIFLDSDDIMLSGYLSNLHGLIKNQRFQEGVDIIFSLPLIFNDTTHEIYSWLDKELFVTLPQDRLIVARDYPAIYGLEVCAWRKVFRREFFISNALFFPEKLKYEDFAHHFKAIHSALNILLTPISSSFYRIGRPGQITGLKDDSRFDICHIMKDGYLYLIKNHCSPRVLSYYIHWCIRFSLWNLSLISTQSRLSFINMLYIYWREVKLSQEISQYLSSYEKSVVKVFQNKFKFTCFFKYEYSFILWAKVSKKLPFLRLIIGQLYE